jgi:RNA polymerase sigma factor FliA
MPQALRLPVPEEHPRVLATLPLVERLARRMASTLPSSVDVGDLVQSGVLGLIDAARRFDDTRGIQFQTFAEPRIRGAMIDALRSGSWPRAVRRQRRDIEAAREQMRREDGTEPSMAALAARMGCAEQQLSRVIVRINILESTSPLRRTTMSDDSPLLPTGLIPSAPESPDGGYARQQAEARVRAAITTLLPREQTIISRYYFTDATMKQIAAEIGVNESRVSQLHAKALRKLRVALETVKAQPDEVPSPSGHVLAFRQRSSVAPLRAAPGSAPLLAGNARGR